MQTRLKVIKMKCKRCGGFMKTDKTTNAVYCPKCINKLTKVMVRGKT